MNNSNIAVLIVEDDEDLRKSIELGFKRHDFNVFSAANGQEALEKTKEHKIDAIITDIRMPKMNGSELIDHINAKNDDHPIIFCMSGHSDLKISESFDKGVDAFFQKPVSSEDLISATKHFIHSRNYLENIEHLIKSQENKILLLNRYSSLGHNVENIAKRMHDPLNIVGTSAALLKNILLQNELDHLKKEKAQKYCNHIITKTEETIDILNSIHHVTQADKSKDKQRASIQKIIADALAHVRIESFKHDIAINMKEVPAHCEIFCHPSDIRQALSNILFNAIDASKNIENPRIDLELVIMHKQIWINICNNGPLIPAHLQKKIFDPFFTTKEKTNQNKCGLGLTLAKQIIEAHDGRLFLKTSTSTQTSFLISLPIIPKDQASS